VALAPLNATTSKPDATDAAIIEDDYEPTIELINITTHKTSATANL